MQKSEEEDDDNFCKQKQPELFDYVLILLLYNSRTGSSVSLDSTNKIVEIQIRL